MSGERRCVLREWRSCLVWVVALALVGAGACEGPSAGGAPPVDAPIEPKAEEVSEAPEDLAAPEAAGDAPEAAPAAPAAAPEEVEPAAPEALDLEALRARYVWLAQTPEDVGLTTLERRFPTPDGYTRVEVAPGSFGAYLRGLPLRTDRVDVRRYDGEPVSMPSAGIIPLDLGRRDLHQCADSVIRLHAEWLWAQGRAEEAAYHFTSGDLASWRRWRQGKVLKVRGSKVVEVSAKKAPDTHAAFRRWLDVVFMYASTRSLHRDSARVKEASELSPGDFFLKGGSPGHVVMLLDVAQGADGSKLGLVGQGYLPAREVHVVEAPGGVDGVWYRLPEDADGTLATPTWAPFSMEDVYRFE